MRNILIAAGSLWVVFGASLALYAPPTTQPLPDSGASIGLLALGLVGIGALAAKFRK